ncbi:hypothetical protein [Amycolatopsis suaedae]|uniref:PqqD family protein n=1 Tax=Amycolatopsis suaedae TaxID=2510978 RepID=A0A4Q7J0U4_9PSEU|nr:hypothetical protein [Amycolatopsis suaedae]RZQ60192.1 hypothetical protein EWH70_29830 [Amycolatopsis suaedae]
MAGLQVQVDPTGSLELSVPGSATQLTGDTEATAMWIALTSHHWNVGDAAVALAGIWEVDPWVLRDDMCSWIGALVNAGILQD